MGIVEVHPEKEFFLIVVREPIQRSVGDDVARTLHFVEIGFLQAAEIEVIVVKIEPVVEAEAPVEDRRANYRAGGVAAFLQNGGERGLLGIQFVGAKVVDAAEHGIGAGEDHSMRRQSHRYGSIGMVEASAVGRERVDVGGFDLLIAVASKVVGAECIYGDDDDVRSGVCRRKGRDGCEQTGARQK